MKAGDSYLEYMGQYPVISLSLKSAKQPDFEMAYGAIVNEISKEFDRHSYVILGDTLSLDEKEQYIRCLLYTSFWMNRCPGRIRCRR